MSSASPSFTLPSATDVLLASPPIGPAVCTPSLRSPITAPPARSVSSVRSLRLPSEAPFAVQTLPLHSGIEILPQPPRRSVATTTAPLTCASWLTERALRSQRRDALRALHNVAVPSSSSPVHLPDTESRFGAQTEYPPMQPLTPRQAIPVHNYSNSAPAPRVTTHVADHLPSAVRTASLRAFSPLAPLRASSSTMPSTTTSATASPQKNSKRATFSGSDSDSAPHPRRTERDRRQVSPVIFHAVEPDSDTPSFPPRIFRPRVTQGLPSRAPIPSTIHDSATSSTVHGSEAASPPP